MKRQVIAFRLASKEFALPIQTVSEVLKDIPRTPVPKMPPHIAGVIPYRDEILPVVDLKRRLGIVGEERDTILLVNLNGASFGLMVDTVLGIKELLPHEIIRNNDPRLSYVYGMAGSLVLLDLSRLSLFPPAKDLSAPLRGPSGG